MKNGFNQISTKQGLKHINKLDKVAGVLIEMLCRTDSVRERWCLPYNQRTRLTESTRAMPGMKEEEEGE